MVQYKPIKQPLKPKAMNNLTPLQKLIERFTYDGFMEVSANDVVEAAQLLLGEERQNIVDAYSNGLSQNSFNGVGEQARLKGKDYFTNTFTNQKQQ